MKKIISVVVTLIVFSLSNAQSISEQNAKKQQLEDEIAFLDKQLSATRSKQIANTKELDFIRKKISNRKKLLVELEKEITNIDLEVAQKEQRVLELDRELNDLKNTYNHLVYNAYRNRDRTAWIMYILASKSIGQGYRRWSYFRNFSETIKQMAGQITSSTERINIEKEQLAKARMSSINTQLKKQNEYNTLTKEEKKAKDVTAQLSKKEAQVKQQLAAKRKEVEKLNKEIERILAEAAKEKESPGYKESDVERVLSDNFGNNKGKLPWPVRSGVVIEEFGQHNHPVFKNIKLPFNNGVNIATEAGADVYSVFEGIVKQILVMPGYNQCVLIQHGNYFTFYTKLDKLSVKSGDKVATGQKIGSLAISEEGSVLHFQLWEGTRKQNPEYWISK
jgi:septal ring factor EnvC (AmiA/AmiB activator)